MKERAKQCRPFLLNGCLPNLVDCRLVQCTEMPLQAWLWLTIRSPIQSICFLADKSRPLALRASYRGDCFPVDIVQLDYLTYEPSYLWIDFDTVFFNRYGYDHL